MKPGADGVAVRGGAVTFQFEGDEVLPGRRVIFEKADPRSSSIGDPDIEIPVEVPICGSKAPAVVRKTEASQGRDVGKICSSASGIEKGTVAFTAAETAVFMEKSAKCSPSLLIGRNGTFGEIINRRLGHDLSPVDTSQVSGVICGDEAVSDENVVPAVIVEINKL